MTLNAARPHQPLALALGIVLGLLGPLVLQGAAASASVPSCAVISIATLNRSLGIDAAKVAPTHPSSPAGSLICSFYGLSGGQKNEATVNFVPATAAAFAAVKASLARQHAITNVAGLLGGAYDYRVSPNNFLLVLDGGWQVQLFAAVRVAKLEALARTLPAL